MKTKQQSSMSTLSRPDKAPLPKAAGTTTNKVTKNSRPIDLSLAEGSDATLEVNRAFTLPEIMNANATLPYVEQYIGDQTELSCIVTALRDEGDKVKNGDLSTVERVLVSQALALDKMFGYLARRAGLNLKGDTVNLEAAQTLLKMGLKAQSQCRATLETLANIKNPPVVYAKQANISNGPQQVNNGTIPHAPAREKENLPSKLVGQSNETPMDIATTGNAGQPDPEMETVDAVNGTKYTSRQGQSGP